jgi:hypothetical protein
LARIEIREIRLESSDNPEQAPSIKETPVLFLMNAFCGQYAEPNEHLQLTHVVPVASSDPSIIGWRIGLHLAIPMEFWFLHRPSRDSWTWEDDEFIPRPKAFLQTQVAEALDGSQMPPDVPEERAADID